MNKRLFPLLCLIALLFTVSSCRTSSSSLDYQSLARASIRTGIEIGKKDNHLLYTEAAGWMGVRYRGGGNNKRGTDCSGLAGQLYKSVYNIDLPRSTDEQLKESHRVARRKLREGDLVFFTSSRSRKRVAHVGIYLKHGKFIHASTSQGVIISTLHEPYYKQHWLRGGRVQ